MRQVLAPKQLKGLARRQTVAPPFQVQPSASLQAATNAVAFAATSAAVIPALHRAPPTPKPSALALRQGATRSGVIPPTGKRCVSFGSTERHPRTASGGMVSAEKGFRPDAPRLSAANASVGVATPGRSNRPTFSARSITAGSAFAPTITLTPAAAAPSTAPGVRTVPA